MRTFLAIRDMTGSPPIFLNTYWPFLEAARSFLQAVPLFIPEKGQKASTRIGNFLLEGSVGRKTTRQWQDIVASERDPNGPNVLILVAFSPYDIGMVEKLKPIWSSFDKHVLMIEENISASSIAKYVGSYDLVTSFCGDLAEQYSSAFDVPVRFEPYRIDTLRYRCFNDFRPIDLMTVGRRVGHLHDPLFHHYNKRDSGRLFLDFVTRTQTALSIEEEFTLLINTFGKSKATFCYDPADVPRFNNRSPLTGRWVHAWISGCTVFGDVPSGSGLAELIDWPEASIRLPKDRSEAIRIIDTILEDPDALARRRSRNIRGAMRSFDIRLLFQSILNSLGISLPIQLRNGLSDLSKEIRGFDPSVADIA